MDFDELKIFLYGLPLDCQESTLKDFLEAVCDFPGAITKVSIPSKKTFAFVTVSYTEVVTCLLGNTLLYCDGEGQLYQVTARPYVKKQFRRKRLQDYKPKATSVVEPKPAKYAPPDHVHQFTPDYSMLSLSKPKRKKRKRDDLSVWFGDVGSTSSRKRLRQKKKKKLASKLEFHKSESFQFGNLCPQSKCVTASVDDATDNTVTESLHPQSKCSTASVEDATDTTGTGNLHPQSKCVTASEEDAMDTTVHITGNLHQQSKCTTASVEDAMETTGVVVPVVQENVQELRKAEEEVPAVDVLHVDDQNATKSLSTISSSRQVIIDHDYLGPLCLQFTRPPSVADVKNELMERTGLPVKDQFLYFNGKKLCDTLNLMPLLDDQDSVTFVLSVGSLKGGVGPKKAPDEGATGGKEDLPSSQDVCSQKAPVEGAIGGKEGPFVSQGKVCQEEAPNEGATGGEDSFSSQEAMQLMETWDVETIATWFCKIGLHKKYGAICQREDINGRALLLLAGKSPDQLLSVFQLKKGPKTILMNRLQPHLEAFDQDKPQTARNSAKKMREWTIEELCCWLRELGVPEECLIEAEKEEINGEAFLLCRASGELKETLQLKVGSSIVLDHELFLHLEKSGSIESDGNTVELPVTENNQLIPTLDRNVVETKEEGDSKEPLASSDPSTKSICETPSEAVLSREEQRLVLLQNALKLDIEASTSSETNKECLIRSIFVKRGKGANALEKSFNFIVITKSEMSADGAHKLWLKIREKAAIENWIKLLPAKDSQSFLWDVGCDSFVHVRTKEKVSLQKGKVGKIFLEKLSDDEYKQSVFVVLVDKQLLDKKKTLTYNFCLDKKHKQSYNIKLRSVKEGKYHGTFDTSNPGQDPKWSDYFKSLINTGVSVQAVSDPSWSEPKPSLTHREQRPQTPRPFDSEFGSKYYNEGFILESWETGSKDLIKPAHEFKLLQKSEYSSEEDSVNKFVYETLRFACGCLNERTNGTIHFGVADEVEGQTCGYLCREIVGTCSTNKPHYNEKLKEFIGKCFVGDSRSSVHNCIRPPVFIPVKGTTGDLHSDDKIMVIEVDIVPSYAFCAGEIFEAGFQRGLDRGREEPAAYIRHGSETKVIDGPEDMKDYLTRRPKLDEERKRRDQELDSTQNFKKQDSLKHLYDKLTRLLCANKKVLDSSIYPILVLSKPDVSMNQEFLNETFRFIQNVKWQVIIDFDDQGSDSNGLCSLFKSGPEIPQCDIHEAEDYVDDAVVEGIEYKTHWIFANGYAKLDKKAIGFKQWNNSDRKKGLSLVMQSLAKTIPDVRAVVLFLLFSKDYEPMADTFKDFCTCLGGPNQLVYVAENSEIVEDWEAKLLSTCLEEHELRERGVVGMSWNEFQECVQQMVRGIDRHQRYVTMASGSSYPVKNVSFNNIDIVSAKECEELRSLSSAERLQISWEVESNFYRGYPVTWRNFWFTDAQKNHVLRRDNYFKLKDLIQKLHSQGSEGKVQTITIYHHIGAGASTMTRQALWDFRCNPQFPYRCAVVTKVDDSTCKELLFLRKIGYGEDSEVSFPPVLALVEDTEDFLFRELRSQVVELANKLARTEWPVCVFLYCKPTQKPQECHLNEKESSVFLEQLLSPEEVDWFKDKYTEMKKQFQNEDPEHDFETYANDNLISFMIMKENFNPKYASSIVERHLSQVTDDELTMLEYTSLLNIYNPYPVYVSCFDTIMVSLSLRRRRIFREWLEDLTHSARIFLREMDVTSLSGTGRTIAVVHPILANELLDKISERKHKTVCQITLDFLQSPLLENQGKSQFTLCDGAKRMLKHRKKYEYGDDTQTKFSPLIEKILYVRETDDEDGKKKPTEESIEQAVEVLREGLDKFKDPMLAQQMARVFYVNAAAFSESRIDVCFNKALTFCNMAIEMNPNNSFLFDTMGRIHGSKMKVLYESTRKENRIIEIDRATPALPLAIGAIKWFQKSLAASVDYQNKYGFHGELSVMFYLLDILRCVKIFRGHEGKKRLQEYLAYSQVIPSEVETAWSKFHESIRDLRNRFSHCIEGLAEDFTIYKGNSAEERLLPNQIASFKTQYLSYFGEGDVKWNTESPEERWEYRWHQINQYLAGDIFSSVFKIHRAETRQESKPPRETLQLLKRLAVDNYNESVHTESYKDLLLMISTSMALHSPYGNSSTCKSARVLEEYEDIYKYVEKLFALEQCDEGHKRVYAHLFKVMFLWPRKDLELSSYRVRDFHDSLKKLRDSWQRKSKGQIIDADKTLKQKVYKNMSFKEPTRQYTTLFYLGNGSGMDVFVHINELTGRGPLDWENPQTKRRLKRLTGVVENKNTIRVQNPLESDKTIDIYYSPFRQGGFSKEEVSFYLGFSWPQPTAFDVQYTNTKHTRHSVEFSGPVSEDQMKFSVPRHNVTYEEYTPRMGGLRRKLKAIDDLKKKKESGEYLDENQEKKLKKEDEIKRNLEELEKSLDALAVLEDEIFD